MRQPTIAGFGVVLTPAQLRCFVTVLAMTDRGQRLSVRSVARSLRVNINAARNLLVALRSKGFVAWEESRGGTLRPLMRVELFAESVDFGTTERGLS